MRYHIKLYNLYGLAPYDPLKRFFKIYINNFPGAAEIRDQLMQTHNSDEAIAVLDKMEASE